jgi:hypothetical protein
MEVSGQLHDPTALPSGKSPWYPLDRRLGGSQSRSGHGGQLPKKFPTFHGILRFIITVLTEPATYPHPGPDESSPHLPTLSSIIILSSRLYLSLPSGFYTSDFSNQSSVRIFHLSHAFYMPRTSHPPSCGHPNNI